MRQNYAELFKRLDGHQNDWIALAEVFAASDLKDRSGKPPSPQTARKTWERIRREAGSKKPTAEVSKPTAHPAHTPVAQIIDPAPRPTTTRRRTFAVSVPKKEI
jgi:hypothetical protein